MSDIPNIYLDDPDPLSVLLEKLALTAEVYVNGGFCGTWAVDTAGSRRIPFHLISEGDAWLHFEDQKPTPLGAGDLVVFPSDAHHIISNSKRRPGKSRVNAPMSNDGATTHMTCGFFEFKNKIAYPLLDALPPVVHLNALAGDDTQRLSHLVRMMQAELLASKAGCYAVVNQLAYLLFVEVLRHEVARGELASGLLLALFDSRVGKALSAIHREPAKNWTLNTLADIALMSRSGFSEQFNQVAGMSPMKYLTLWRMTEAHRLLSTTELSTAQIAEMSGYETEAAFRKAFKNSQGVAPGSVRKSARAQ